MSANMDMLTRKEAERNQPAGREVGLGRSDIVRPSVRRRLIRLGESVEVGAPIFYSDLDSEYFEETTKTLKEYDFTRVFCMSRPLVAQLENKELVGALLSDIRISQSQFIRCDMRGVSFKGSHIEGGTEIVRSTAPWSDLSDTDTEDISVFSTSFFGANLKNATFDHGTFVGCDFTGANLTSASFEGARVESCRFDLANLKGTAFDGATVRGCTFLDCKGVDLQRFPHEVPRPIKSKPIRFSTKGRLRLAGLALRWGNTLLGTLLFSTLSERSLEALK